MLPTEQSYLQEHLPGSWLSYRSALELLIDWRAGTTQTQQHDLARVAAQHYTPFGDAPVRAMNFRTLLEMLALVPRVKPVILRVPLLHWLPRWAAQHAGSTLRCPQIQAVSDGAAGPAGTPAQRPAPCPIGAQTSYEERRSRERNGSIAFPTALKVLAAAKTKARAVAGLAAAPAGRPSLASIPADSAPSRALPTWEKFLEHAPHTGTQNGVSLLDGLTAVSEASASHVAGTILIIIKDLRVPNRAHQLLNLATTTALLVQAARTAWLQCPEPCKHQLRPQLERLCVTVASKFGSTLNTSAKNAALQAIQPHITANADRPGVNWTSFALQMAATTAFPITAYTAVQGVVDAATFRQGIHQLCKPTYLRTTAE